MKKIISIFLLITMALLAFTSCHGTKKLSGFEVPESLDMDKTYDIVFWAKNDTNKIQTQTYERAIKEFHELYPNINVTLKLYTDYQQIYKDVITNIGTGTTPNICITYPDHIATYNSSENMIVPIGNLINDKNYGLGGQLVLFDSPTKDDVYSKYLDELKVGGVLYGLPFVRSTEACYINKTYVEKLGYTIPDVLTWDWIFEVSEAAMKKDDSGNYVVNGQKTLIPFIYKSTDNMMIQMLKQKEAGYSNDEGDILIFNDDAKEILYMVNKHVATGAFSTFKISSYPGNFLNAGQCIFAIDSTAGSTWIGCDAPNSDIAKSSIVEFETIVKEIPQFDVDNPQMISQGPSICIFNKEDNGEVLASWLFAQYLLTDDIQISYATTEGYMPVTKTAVESEKYSEYLNSRGADLDAHYSVKIDATKVLLNNIDNTFITPVWNGSTSLRNAAGDMIEYVAKRTRRNQVVDDNYIDVELKNDMTSLYKLNDITKPGSSNNKKDFGPLPSGAIILIISLAVAWVSIIVVFAIKKIKEKSKIR